MKNYVKFGYIANLIVQPIGAVIGMYANMPMLVGWCVVCFGCSASILYFNSRSIKKKHTFKA